jgi:hypothetical protein
MRVADPRAFLALRRWLWIEPAAHLYGRAAERLRNGIEAMAFAGHALRSYQLLERPRWSLSLSGLEQLLCHQSSPDVPS